MKKVRSLNINQKGTTRGTITRGVITLILVTTGLATLTGCAREKAKRQARANVFAPPPKDPVLIAAEQKIDLSALPADLALQERVNNMPFAEIIARLGSASYSGHYVLSMRRDKNEKKQTLDAAVSQDAAGNFTVAVNIKNGDRQHLVYADKVLYLKHNYGHWRASRDPTDERKRWREQAYHIWPSFYALFAKHLSFSQGTAITYHGRPALRFELSVKAQQELPAPMPRELTRDIPEDAGLARWRALAERGETWRAYTVTDSGGGSLVVDNKTGSPLKIDFSGQLRVEDVVDHPVMLKVELNASLDKIGQTTEIQAPKDFVEEYSRRKTITDPLSFMGPDAPVRLVIPESKKSKKSTPKATEKQP